jgi:hypothetical protein
MLSWIIVEKVFSTRNHFLTSRHFLAGLGLLFFSAKKGHLNGAGELELVVRHKKFFS